MRIVFLAFFHLFTLNPVAQPGISGYVRDYTTGRPLVGARCLLERLDSVLIRQVEDSIPGFETIHRTIVDSVFNGIKRTFTDSLGYFCFDPPGKKVFIVLPDGCRTYG